jgi:hypothetical protein
MLLEEDFIKYLSQERLSPYLKLARNNFELAMNLYSWNIKLSESFYGVLCYFEVALRNVCSEKLRKELGDGWFHNKKLLSGNNPENDSWAIDKIRKTEDKIRDSKRSRSYLPTNGDMISSLELGFWTGLFSAKHEHNLWTPYLKHIFPGISRKKLFKEIDGVRRIRNRIFHYEQILYNYDLEKEYYRAFNLLNTIISNTTIIDDIRNASKFTELFEEYKKTRAVLQTIQ